MGVFAEPAVSTDINATSGSLDKGTLATSSLSPATDFIKNTIEISQGTTGEGSFVDSGKGCLRNTGEGTHLNL